MIVALPALLVASNILYRLRLPTSAAYQGALAMIGYVTLGTNDLVRGARFYDAIAKELGVGRTMETDRFIAWGKPGSGAGICLRCRSMVSRLL